MLEKVKQAASALVLGASGLLGHQVYEEYARRYGRDVHGIFRTRKPNLSHPENLHPLELLDSKSVEAFLRKLKPKTVINCAGIVRSLCFDSDEVMAVNSAVPHLIAKTIEEWGGRLVQVSTDCVFSGKKGNYSETDVADPTDLYSRSKLLGEVCHSPHLTVRTSFIGYELGTRRGLLEWFLAQKGKVKGFRRAVWSGLTSNAAAGVLAGLVSREDITGLLNVSGEAIDKYSLLQLIADVFDKRDVTVKPVDEPVVNLSLQNQKLTACGFSIPSVKNMLVGLKDIKTHGVCH